jgi:hypothetical protein
MKARTIFFHEEQLIKIAVWFFSCSGMIVATFLKVNQLGDPLLDASFEMPNPSLPNLSS